MSRLTAEQWEQARADYEVRGLSLGEIARRFGISQQAVSKRAQKEGWKQGKSCDLVNKKVNAIKELYEVEKESCDCPQLLEPRLRMLFENVLKQSSRLPGLTKP